MPYFIGISGGAERDRTADLVNAIHALSQLSYGPMGIGKPAQEGFPPPARLSMPRRRIAQVGSPTGHRIRRRWRDGRRPVQPPSRPRRHDRKRGEQARTRLFHGTYIGPLTAGHAALLASRQFGRAWARRRRGRHGKRRDAADGAVAAGDDGVGRRLGTHADGGGGSVAGAGRRDRQRVRVRGPRSLGKARARQSRHRRGDGVERPRRGANRRGGTVAAAGADGDSVFVIKPPHWATPAGLGGVAQFSRLHQPAGSPTDIAYRHAGVAATGTLPASIDLPLTPTRGERSFRGRAVRGHAAGERHGARIPARRHRRRRARHEGCVRHQPRRCRVRRPRPLSALPADPGGHRASPGTIAPATTTSTRKPATTGIRARPGSACSGRGTTPSSMAAPRSSCSITCIISATTRVRRAAARYAGLIGERQLQFVRNVLAHVPREQLVVLSMHIPLVTYQDPARPSDNTADRRALLRLLASARTR